MGPTCKPVVALIRSHLGEACQYPLLTGSPAPKWIGCIEATDQKREGKIEDRMGAHTHKENLPWSKMVIHTKQHRESNRT